MSEAAAAEGGEQAAGNNGAGPVHGAPDTVQASFPVGDPALTPFIKDGEFNGEDFLKSYNSAQDVLSRSVRIPSENAGEEDRQKFDERLQGLGYRKPGPDEPGPPPATPGEYAFTDPEGWQNENPATDQAFAKAAHEAGLSNRQADAIRSHLVTEMLEETRQHKEMMDNAWGELQSTWGATMEHNLKAGEQLLSYIEGLIPGATEHFNDAGLMHDPMVRQVLAAIASRMDEPQMQQGGLPTGVMSPDEAALRISEMMNNPNHAIQNTDDPGYEAAQRELDRLYMIKAGQL